MNLVNASVMKGMLESSATAVQTAIMGFRTVEVSQMRMRDQSTIDVLKCSLPLAHD